MSTLASPVDPIPSAATAGLRQHHRYTDLLLVLPFILFFLFQLAHHEMWRDELNAWGIAAASPNLKVLYQYIRYEGHPSLWYLILWVPSRFTTSPVAMQCIEACVGTAIYLTIALWSPFTRLEKVLLYAGYFISFEYTVMSRMYGVCLLLALIYAHRRVTRPQQWTTNLLLLGLMANTDVSGLNLSLALLLEYLAASFLPFCRPTAGQPKPDPKQVTGGLLVYAAGVAGSVLALRISPHISWRTTGHMFQYTSDLWHLLQAIVSYVAVPWFPIADGFPHHFWSPSLAAVFQFPFRLWATPVIIAAMVTIFHKDRSLLLLWLSTAIGAITFGHLVFMGGTRHYGITFTAFLVAYWIQRYWRGSRPLLGLLVLAVTAVAGVQAAIAQRDHPFSNGSAAAQWLRNHHLENEPVVGTPDTSVIGVAEQLRRPIYMLDCSCSGTFLLFSIQRDDFNPDQTPQRLARAAEDLHARQMVLLTTYPLPDERIKQIEAEHFSTQQLAKFTGAEELEENYFIYRVTRQEQ